MRSLFDLLIQSLDFPLESSEKLLFVAVLLLSLRQANSSTVRSIFIKSLYDPQNWIQSPQLRKELHLRFLNPLY